jgi:hypothetical protein
VIRNIKFIKINYEYELPIDFRNRGFHQNIFDSALLLTLSQYNNMNIIVSKFINSTEYD